MPDELIMRGMTETGGEEILNFGGRTPGYAYQIIEFSLYPTTTLLQQAYEIAGTITAASTAEDPTNPNFNHPGLIAVKLIADSGSQPFQPDTGIINDLFYITQDLILLVQDTHNPTINWQCKFRKVKLSSSAEAVANYNQFTIYD